MRRLVVATQNRHKLEEYRDLLAGMPFELCSLADLGVSDDVDETGTTFEENARIKAEAYRDLTGTLCLADDSGIEVDAINREPGVHSRRWAGDVDDAERNRLLLERIKDVPEERRTGRFRCAIAVAEPGRETVVVEGAVEGRIAWEPKGPNGFGYDPIFFVPELGMTLGEAPAAVKNGLSHRARAAAKAKAVLPQLSS
ncbi:MAG TPA: RdgB/HAM1 family non-canonical purine NTP pyrophosphatase [Chloroflexota bacterium]|jgi:XTP/dITP diphosphohydrolase|nr:RdgB/HAM1 family non-canonical purine NTP pyrophosphatase [Chloroflexota bacterium]